MSRRTIVKKRYVKPDPKFNSPLVSLLSARILKSGTGYQTDAGMCGDYDSVIGMNTENSLNRFLKKNSTKHFPALGEATLCGVIVDCNIETGLANKVGSYIFGGKLRNI